MSIVPKMIEVLPGKSWINITEFPDETLRFEGIRECEMDKRTYEIASIRFTKEAIEKLTPLLIDWLKEKKAEK